MSVGPPGRLDPATVLALALVAYPLASLVHEGLGHGFACLVVGGDLEGVSLARCSCDKTGLSPWAVRGVKAAGTVANLASGSVAAFAAARIADPRGRYLCALFASVSLLLGTGYLLVDPLGGFGDWSAFLEGLPGWLRWVFVAVGLAGYTASISVLLRLLDPFLGLDPAGRVRRARTLCLVPYLLVGGVAMTAVHALDRAGGSVVVTGGLATLGGTSGLAWAWTLAERRRSSGPTLGIPRSPRVVAAAVLGFIVLAAVFGPGFPR